MSLLVIAYLPPILAIVLILFTFLKGNVFRKPDAKLFCAFLLLLTSWLTLLWLADAVNEQTTSLILLKVALAVGSFVPSAFLLFSQKFIGANLKYINIGAYIASLCLAIASLLGIVIRSIEPGEVGIRIVNSTWLYSIQTVYTVLLIGASILWMRARVSKYKREQVKIISIGAVIALIVGSVGGNLINQTDGSNLLSPFAVSIFAITSYIAVFKYKLFDIKLVVVRAVTYALLLAVLGVVYVFGTFAISSIFFKDTASDSRQRIYDISLVVILLFIFQPLRRWFEEITDSVFYRDHYDPDSLLNSLGSIMAHEIELQHLTDGVLKELTNQMRLSKASVVVLDENKIFFEGTSEATTKKIDAEDLKDLDQGLVVKDTLESNTVPEIFEKYDFSISIGLRSTNELVGYLLLGNKKSGDIFNGSDIKTLNILANELAVAIHNAKSYTQIQSFNKTLQVKIGEATHQLRDANEHLKELDEIKNEFLSMATHQLNTPLAAVDGYLSMMTDGIIADPKEQHETLEKLLHRVRMMKHLVTDFLNVSRIEAGTFVIEPTPVDLNKMVTEQVNELGPAAKEKEVFLQYIAPKHPLPLIEVDEQKISQAVMNLTDNAIYYTPKGNVKVYLDSDGQNAIFKVVDNGIGVPEDQKAKLFQKFARADNAKKERPNGNGVGLYLVKLVVEAHGGKIIFESTEGKGSVFGFSIPLKVKENLNTKVQAPKPKEAVPA